MANIINVTYQSNYNGCHIWDVEEDQKYNNACNSISSALFNDCDEDGQFVGNETRATKFIIQTIKDVYGADVQVNVEFDWEST